ASSTVKTRIISMSATPGYRRLRVMRRQPQLPKQIVGAVDSVHHPQHVHGVDVNRARQLRIDDEVGAEGLVVAVEEKTGQFAVRVERRRAGVASRGVASGEEVDRDFAEARIRVAVELAVTDRRQEILRAVEFAAAGVLL